MSTDDEHFQRLGSKDSPQLPRSLATFIGQMLGNHYQDTVMAPLSDELQRLVDALDVAERDEDAADTERKRPGRVLSWASARAPCGRERPAFRRADTQRARCKNSDATRSTIGVWLDALAMVFRLHHQGASGLAFAKQRRATP